MSATHGERTRAIRVALRDRLARARRSADWPAFEAAAAELFDALARAGGLSAATDLDLVILFELAERWLERERYEDAWAAAEAAREIAVRVRRDLVRRADLLGASALVGRVELDAAQMSLERALGLSVGALDELEDRASISAAAAIDAIDATEAADLRLLALVALATWASSQGRHALVDGALGAALEMLSRTGAGAYAADDLELLRARARLDAGRPLSVDAASRRGPRWRLIEAMDAALRGKLSHAERILAEAEPSSDATVTAQARLARAQVLARLNRLAESEGLLRSIEGPDAELGLALVEARRDGVTAFLSPSAHELVTLVAGPVGEVTGARASRDPRARWRASLAAEIAERCQWVLLLLHGAEGAEQELRLAEARSIVDALEPWMSHCDAPLPRARASQARALVTYREGRREEARRHALAAASWFEEAGAPLEASSALRVAEWACADDDDLGPASSLRARQEELTDRVRAQLAPSDQNLFGLSRWTQEDEALARHCARVERATTGAAPRARRANVAGAFTQLGAVRRWRPDEGEQRVGVARTPEEVARAAAALRAIAGFEDPGDHLTPALLPADTAVVRYVVLPDRIEILWLTGADGAVLPAPAGSSRIALREALGRALEWISTAPRWNARARPLRILSEILGIPALLAALPHRARRLYIVPDDLVVQTPFGSLVADLEPLAARYEVAIVPSAFFGSSSAKTRASSVLAVASPSSADARLPELRGVDDEVDAVRAVYAAGTVLHGPQATRDAVARSLPRARVAHLACHGQFDARRLADSGFLLHDGWLACEELAGADLRAVEVAVLASCWSGAANVLPGREILGLPTVLLRSGVKEVIASLLEVDDLASPAFSAALHSELSRGCASRALARAQLAWWSDGRPPSEWAAHVAFRNGVPPVGWAAPWIALRRLWRRLASTGGRRLP